MRHPADLGPADVTRFLSSLAERGQVSASTQNQALGALLFLYRKVRVRAVFERLRGTERLVAGLLYGSGLRLFEALELRVKDIDFERGEIVIRRGKRSRLRASCGLEGAR